LRGNVKTYAATPGIYFRSLLIGYFEGMGAERGIAWRLADSLALRRFVGVGLDEYTPDAAQALSTPTGAVPEQHSRTGSSSH
jgi:transposase